MRWFGMMLAAALCAAGLAAPSRAVAGLPTDGSMVASAFTDPDPFAGVQGKKDEDDDDGEAAELTPEEQALADKLATIEEANATAPSRVVVLKWPEKDVDYQTEAVQRNVRTRISRADAKFYPEIDLYQAGRVERDASVRPSDQRAMVPDSAIDMLDRAVAEVSTIPWNALEPQDWGVKANMLRGMLDEVWFVDRPELREPLFKMYLQIGRAADNRRDNAPPFYEYVGREAVNYYWYLAATLAWQDPDLMSKVLDQDLHASVSYYKEMLDAESIDSLTLSFELEGIFDVEQFAKDYTLYINGKEETVTRKDSLLQMPPGRLDIYLKRSDGHSLSQRVELERVDKEIQFVRDVARKRMGKEFIEQLMKHPNDCIPDLSGDIVNYLSIYAKLHPTSEIYIAVPRDGNPNKVFLWRWERVKGVLVRVLDDTQFPVRFALVFSAGTAFNGAGVSAELADDQTVANAEPGASPADLADITPTLSLAGIPLEFQLRGHYSRLLVMAGVDWIYGVQGKWTDYYHTDVNKRGNIAVPTESSTIDPTVTTSAATTTPTETEVDGQVVALKSRTFSPLYYGQVGVVFLRDAAIGFGPRLAMRVGYYQIPNAIDTTLHAGLSAQAPFSQAGGRVRPLVDIDAYGGAMIPLKNSVLQQSALVNFGLTLGLGVTF
jgi:hypothetical protein